MINFVCWKWQNLDGSPARRKDIYFTDDHVNRLRSMIERNLKAPFKLHCITDNGNGIDARVNVIPLWDEYREMGGCYTRLKMFHPSMADLIGPDFFSIDLDTVIMGDITPLVTEARANHEFKIWGDTSPGTPYNGGFQYLKAGTRAKVYNDFDPRRAVGLRKELGYIGTDQAWIAACLGSNEAKWSTDDGVYSFRVHYKNIGRFELYGNETIVFFHGSSDPSKESTQQLAGWIGQHWR